MGAKNQASLIFILISIIVVLLLINGCTPEQEQQLKEKYTPEVKEVVKEAVKEALQNNTQTDNIICNPPYIRVGNNCCLDANNNSICDNDEPAKSEEPSQMSNYERSQYLLDIYNNCARECYYNLTPEERGQEPTPCQAKCKQYKDDWDTFQANITQTVYPIVEAPKEEGPPPPVNESLLPICRMYTFIWSEDGETYRREFAVMTETGIEPTGEVVPDGYSCRLE